MVHKYATIEVLFIEGNFVATFEVYNTLLPLKIYARVFCEVMTSCGFLLIDLTTMRSCRLAFDETYWILIGYRKNSIFFEQFILSDDILCFKVFFSFSLKFGFWFMLSWQWFISLSIIWKHASLYHKVFYFIFT